jgi:hypothetical protein
VEITIDGAPPARCSAGFQRRTLRNATDFVLGTRCYDVTELRVAATSGEGAGHSFPNPLKRTLQP